MKWTVWVTMGCGLTLAGCRQEQPPARQRATPTVGRVAEGRAGPREEGPYRVTEEKLEGFIRYQKALLGVHEALLKDLERVGVKADGGGLDGAVSASMRVLEGRARAEEQARQEAGLTEEDVRELDRVVSAVINKRSLGTLVDASAAIKQWGRMRLSVPEEQRAGIDETLADLQEQQEEIQGLAEERRRFGDANIDMVLTREQELIRNQEAYLQKLTGGKR